MLRPLRRLTQWFIVIGILLRSTARYSWVEHHQPQLVFGWVTVLVCQFLVVGFGLKSRSLSAIDSGTLSISVDSPLNETLN